MSLRVKLCWRSRLFRIWSNSFINSGASLTKPVYHSVKNKFWLTYSKGCKTKKLLQLSELVRRPCIRTCIGFLRNWAFTQEQKSSRSIWAHANSQSNRGDSNLLGGG